MGEGWNDEYSSGMMVSWCSCCASTNDARPLQLVVMRNSSGVTAYTRSRIVSYLLLQLQIMERLAGELRLGFLAQSKAPLIITNEGTKDRNVIAEVALYIQNKQDSRNHHFEHADLAKLVVDVECKGAHKEPKVVLGERETSGPEGKGVVQGTDIAQKNDDELQGGTTVSNPMGEESDPGFRSNHESDKQAIEAQVEIRRKTCTSLPCSLEVEVTNTRSRCDTPLHRSKMKGLHDLGEPSTHPRRSVRPSEKSSRARKELLTGGVH
ncbi:hypothetical protein ACSQ67_015140 [Phaseolus vulgaris]